MGPELVLVCWKGSCEPSPALSSVLRDSLNDFVAAADNRRSEHAFGNLLGIVPAGLSACEAVKPAPQRPDGTG